MSKLVRVTLDLNGSIFMVERGEMRQLGLSKKEKAELRDLKEQLEPYGDFTSFKDLSEEEIESITNLKKRRGELEQKEGRTQTDFFPIPQDEIKSVVFVASPGYINVYVENMPREWIEKLFSQQLVIENLNIGTRAPVAQTQESETQKEEYTLDPELSRKHNKVREIVHKVNPDLFNILDISEQDDFIYLRPKKWLGDNWKPLDEALKTQFGEGAAWISGGQGDREAHWEVL